MCQNIAVKTVVDGFVAKGFMFTAFDVTKFLRASGSQVYHRDVNKAVQEMFRHGEMPDYEHDTFDVGAQVAPFVYYHRNADVANYQPDWLTNNPDQTGMLNDATSPAGVAQPAPSSYGSSPVAPVTPVAKAPVASVTPKGVHPTDKEGRLYVAPVVTKAAGLAPLQNVVVVKDNGRLVIQKSAATFGQAWPYTVNSDGRIRICRSLLRMIAKDGSNFKVSAASGNIEVVPA